MRDRAALRVLLVDDDEGRYLLTRKLLNAAGLEFILAWTPSDADALERLVRRDADVALVAYRRGACSGLDLVREAIAGHCDVPLIILTAPGDEAVDLEAIEIGAADYLHQAHLTADVLSRTLRFAVTHHETVARMHEQVERTRVALETTARKELEEQFRRMQRMEAVGRLAVGIAHDFNNLLTVIVGLSDLVLQRIGTSHDAAADVGEIQKAGRSAATLTAQLLAFSRHQMRQQQEIDLNEVVQRVDSIVRRLIGGNITLITNLAMPLGAVSADPGQIEQVILNLAVNARDAMPQGGTLTVETANVELGEDDVARHTSSSADPHVMLAVTDTGVGMDEAVKKRLFEPFFTTKARGSGLGLSNVYGTVKQSGGSIRVHSERGRGSTFRVYLPRCR